MEEKTDKEYSNMFKTETMLFKIPIILTISLTISVLNTLIIRQCQESVFYTYMKSKWRIVCLAWWLRCLCTLLRYMDLMSGSGS